MIIAVALCAISICLCDLLGLIQSARTLAASRMVRRPWGGGGSPRSAGITAVERVLAAVDYLGRVALWSEQPCFMTLELSQVFRLRRGNHDEAVGPLADEGVAYLRSSTSIVRVCGERVRHFDDRQRSLTDFEIITMSYGLAHGLFIADDDNTHCLLVNYCYPDTGVRYKIAVKVANNYTELWVSTFHRLKPRQTIPLLKRGRIIRTHD